MIKITNNPKIAPNFNLGEFVCHCGCNSLIYEPSLPERLQKVRDTIGPITVAVGYRCPTHNKNVGGDPNSRHMKGLAADIKSSKPIWELAKACYDAGFDGIGVSDNKNSKPISGYYVHVQVGGERKFWTYDNYNKSTRITEDEFLRLIGRKSHTYEMIGTTHIVRCNPMDLRAEIANCLPSQVKHKTFWNFNYFWYDGSTPKVIGWLISEGKILNERHVDPRWDKPKGTFIVFKDGTVSTEWQTDSTMTEMAPKIWFACQGFNLFPPNMTVRQGIAAEGFDYSSVGYSTNRISMGFDGKQVVAIARPATTAERAQQSLKNLDCNMGTGGDSGTPATFFVDGKAMMASKNNIQAIVYLKGE